jgi:hypothetical protein
MAGALQIHNTALRQASEVASAAFVRFLLRS